MVSILTYVTYVGVLAYVKKSRHTAVRYASQELRLLFQAPLAVQKLSAQTHSTFIARITMVLEAAGSMR